MPPERALAEILANSGSQFDPAAVKAFLSVYQTRFLHSHTELELSPSLKKAILKATGLEGSS